MAEEKNSGATSNALDLFIKLFPIIWPVVVVAIVLSAGYGKRDSNTEFLITQNSQLQTKIDNLLTQLTNLSQRVATLEGAYKANQDSIVQEQMYRERTNSK